MSKTQCKTKTKNNKLQHNGQKTKPKMTKRKQKIQKRAEFCAVFTETFQSEAFQPEDVSI